MFLDLIGKPVGSFFYTYLFTIHKNLSSSYQIYPIILA